MEIIKEALLQSDKSVEKTLEVIDAAVTNSRSNRLPTFGAVNVDSEAMVIFQILPRSSLSSILLIRARLLEEMAATFVGWKRRPMHEQLSVARTAS